MFEQNRRRITTTLSEINVTPFVDVMLVLLVIFMVTTPLLEKGIDVDLPKEPAKDIEAIEKSIITKRTSITSTNGVTFISERVVVILLLFCSNIGNYKIFSHRVHREHRGK